LNYKARLANDEPFLEALFKNLHLFSLDAERNLKPVSQKIEFLKNKLWIVEHYSLVHLMHHKKLPQEASKEHKKILDEELKLLPLLNNNSKSIWSAMRQVPFLFEFAFSCILKTFTKIA
jgi:hypothetical protein